jgi:type IV pilus assembly protein PilY1
MIKQFRVVFIGTGKLLGLSDLQDPIQETFYAFKDTGAPLGNLRTSGNLVQQTLSGRDPLTRTVTNTPVNWSSNNGWFIDFNPGNTSPGERVNIDPLLTLGTLTIHTNIPNADACSVGGDGWVYQLSYDTGSYVPTSPGQIVGQKISGATVVGFVIVGLPGGGLKEIATDAFKRHPIFAVPLGAGRVIGRRIGWREITR